MQVNAISIWRPSGWPIDYILLEFMIAPPRIMHLVPELQASTQRYQKVRGIWVGRRGPGQLLGHGLYAKWTLRLESVNVSLGVKWYDSPFLLPCYSILSSADLLMYPYHFHPQKKRCRMPLLLNRSPDHLSCDCLCLEECPKLYRGAWRACRLVAMRTEATNARATLGRARESQEQWAREGAVCVRWCGVLGWPAATIQHYATTSF